MEFQTSMHEQERVVFSTTTKSYIHEISGFIDTKSMNTDTISQLSLRERCVTYEGVITARIGECIFELDGFDVENRLDLEQIRLFFTHWPCSNGGRGLRQGVRIRVSNAIPMYATTFPHKVNYG
eukprot:CAMPEP_0204833742 /NCGR_PEP_ID=MMETSP1346-20131115/17648_1 /ASSEMBLY_ACC=CAM_ASM_000771 /TAXON_ID=215587 /ORGANISM="Aplanochytrium stocchinoi, Strain GSBS06" /LENGTH=123 /DNA_ID=CAMNT_0051966495 /DNA_START=6 /DNA_END=374 /DNA_ORIENTATION=-